MLKNINLEKEVFAINFNWAYVLAFVSLWAYSFYFRSPFVVLFIPFLLLSKKEEFLDRLAIKLRDIFVFTSYLLLMLILSMDELTLSLTGDQIYHAQRSQWHSVWWSTKLVENFDFLSGLSFKLIVHGFNISYLFLGVLTVLIAGKLKFENRLIFLIIVCILTLFFKRIILGPHPPFRLFPLWISSTILSPSDFSFRFAQFIALILSMVGIQRFTVNHLGLLNSWLLGLTIGTIPVLWYVGVVVEPSIWSSILFIFLSLKFLFRSKEINYIRWFSLVSIASLMRHSAFVAFVPLGLMIYFDLYRKNEHKDYKKILLYASPVLLMVPFVADSIISGTPATYNYGAPNTYNFVPENANFIQRILISITSGVAITAILNSINPLWLSVSIFSFIPLKKKEILGKVIWLIFFILLFSMFYSIRSDLWGVGRYQAEYVVPFVVAGFVYILFKINNKSGFAISAITSISLIFLAVFNIYDFNRIPQINKPHDIVMYEESPNLEMKVISDPVYDYRSAYKALKDENLGDAVYIMGVTYGVFGHIINNFNYSDYSKAKKLQEKHDFRIEYDFDEIDADKDIKVVLISDVPKKDLIKKFEENG
ncbi:hypothetical protein S1OALGB6SA_175, partial [Olavius algarvensis spirochete endosymbiont]|uniref:hypothetical protein n=1 Tax=Olavius algarvensis spirochete endosymbiont TaxID=260710 RepID=UPI000F22E047